ncbi:hypothetical protein FJ930_07940 [Mesorhizobium sp. B2-4-15]|uniref:hypothetical protein n=1 Tax=Mesorhizobium sp. B2-4-15 TaxID=2589934 RepID=UPI001151CA40|nr:hypothetical protein [Mesorhizobium sp. B2-4-15]TPK73975.1 hypothetical protein FJ930_07940 [Mesorhizobium sp. B2-4-15]
MSDHAFPTHADVRKWQAQLEQLVTEESAMKARHAEEEARIKNKRTRLNKLIEAASAFMDAMDDESPVSIDDEKPGAASVPEPEKPQVPSKSAIATPATRRASNQTWTATIHRVIQDEGRGLTYQELKEGLLKTHLGETLQRTDKAFYGGIAKLESRQMIVKHNGRLFSPSGYKRFMNDVAAGLVEDTPYTAASNSWQMSPNEAAVARLLSLHPKGLTTSEIVESLLNDPPPDLAVTKNRNSLYNLLARERERGNLVKEGDTYSLPLPETESSGSDEEAAA